MTQRFQQLKEKGLKVQFEYSRPNITYFIDDYYGGYDGDNEGEREGGEGGEGDNDGGGWW